MARIGCIIMGYLISGATSVHRTLRHKVLIEDNESRGFAHQLGSGQLLAGSIWYPYSTSILLASPVRPCRPPTGLRSSAR
ncbi:hypothetical protein HZ326_11740 [Fusarium oxysporum f. sp. albedinis]|nr:hypothetical protein HZ326_11740 [Fusarium oxysporum f. sp. albedinis]